MNVDQTSSMSKQKSSQARPGLPKGTRDFGPQQMVKRNFILNTIREVFRTFGYQPLETPSMENLSVLTGKYGDEGDKLLFRVLESGDFLDPVKKKFLGTKELGHLNDFFEDSLGNLIKIALAKDIRNPDKLIEMVKQEVDKFSPNLSQFALYLDDDIIEKLKDYFKNKTPYISLIIGELINKAHLYKEIAEEDLRHYIRQFKSTHINEKIIPFFVTNYLSKEYVYLEDISSSDVSGDISKKGLRYDLTVPFARYVVMNQHDITFPFKRYQIQPVWRADRPQKGRYREFYQCDADVVGTDSLICEAEIVLMIEQVFQELDIQDFTININSRKVLKGIIEAINGKAREAEIIVALDKLDKISKNEVLDVIKNLGVSDDGLEILSNIIDTSKSDLTNQAKIDNLKSLFVYAGRHSAERHTAGRHPASMGSGGLEEIQEIFDLVNDLGSKAENLQFDITLARGLSYYTGAIFEVKVNNSTISSSVSGGGRYDNLTGVFGLPGVSGVGISFGVDRIYDVMEELGLFPEESLATTQVLLVNFDRETEKHVLGLLSQLRQAGISAEIYPDPVKLKKQFAYADKKGIPYILVAGAEEVKSQRYGLKDLKTGTQTALSLYEIIQRLKQ